MVFQARLGACLLILSSVGTAAAETAADSLSFSAWQRSIINSLSLRTWPDATALAADGNAVRDNKDAALLGQQLFFDPRFSANGNVSCASCHQPEKAFTDGLSVATGIGVGTRNTPTLIGVTLNRWYFADGRRDSAWSQAIAPIETPHEMGSDRLSALRVFFGAPRYRDAYARVFNDPPPSPELLTRASAASPLSDDKTIRTAWNSLDPDEKTTINRHFSNLGKLIAAYEHQLRPAPTAFDRYAEVLASEGAAAAKPLLSDDARAGLRFFIDPSNQCLKCHSGPTLSNGEFHNIGTGVSPSGQLDFGRAKGAELRAADPFNCYGAFNTGADRVCELGTMFGSMGANVVPLGAFRTPTLRQLRYTAPYFHDGRAQTLTEVFKHYQDPPEGYGHAHELWPARALDELAQHQLEAFFDSLSSPPDADIQ